MASGRLIEPSVGSKELFVLSGVVQVLTLAAHVAAIALAIYGLLLAVDKGERRD